jgi:Protein phosphatase 2C
VDAAVVDEEREEEESAATISSDTSITTAVADSSPSSSSPVKDNDGDIDASSESDDIAGDDVAADSVSTATSTEKKAIGSDSISTSCDETGKPQEQGIHEVTTPSSPTTTTTTITSETMEGDNQSTEKADGDIVTETDEAKEEVHDRPDSDDKNSIDSDKDVEDAVASSSSGSDDDEDSEQAAGVEEAAELDRDLMNDEDDDDENDVNDKDENDGDDVDDDDDGAIEHTPLPALPAVSAVESSPPSISTTTAGKVSTMFQRLLSLSGTSPAVATGQFAAVLSGSIVGGSSSSNAAAAAGSTGILPPPPPPPPPPPLPPVGSPGGGPCASLPTIVQNGRMICNLPEHPIHAGATAIVAVICGKTLTVANAGDSRAVLCRGGGGGSDGADHQTLALSFDHKPQQEVEMNRIHRAGGFVNHFGRVNGNLNLSRSIGDLKYKQVPGIRPADQMISAEPDIVEYVLCCLFVVACGFCGRMSLVVLLPVWFLFRNCFFQSPT